MFDLIGLHDYLVSVFHRPVDMVSVEYIRRILCRM